MDRINKLKLAVYEAESENLIKKDLSDKMISFCESADIDNEEDVAMLREMTETLINITERAIDGDGTESSVVSRDSIALEIFESEKCGDITSDERDLLLEMLDGVN